VCARVHIVGASRACIALIGEQLDVHGSRVGGRPGFAAVVYMYWQTVLPGVVVDDDGWLAPSAARLLVCASKGGGDPNALGPCGVL
jgi:hypothetical protein